MTENGIQDLTSASTSTARPFYVTGGSMPEDSPSYVVRQADAALLQALQQRQFCYVLDSRQVGKSSLMVRTAASLRQGGVRVALLDLSAFGRNPSIEQWYYGLLYSLGEQLGIEHEMDRFWEEHAELSPVHRWVEALRRVALAELAQSQASLVVFVDEIDAVRGLPFSADEFFGAIRECHNRRTRDEAMERLTFCLLGAATPSRLIQNVETTPFNIGEAIELTDFTLDEALPLINGLLPSSTDARRVFQRILFWTGGHPYLTQLLCRAVAEAGGVSRLETVDRLCENLFLSRQGRESDHNLVFVRNRILDASDVPTDIASVLTLYRQVRRGRRPVPFDPKDPNTSLLRLAGIVVVRDGRLGVRNRIYAQVFDERWIRSSMPGEEVRRQRRAMRAGFARASVAWAIVAVALTVAMRQTYAAQAAAKENVNLKADKDKLSSDISALLHDIETRRAEKANLIADTRAARANFAAARRALANAERQRRAAMASLRTALGRTREANSRVQLAESARQRAIAERSLVDDQARIARFISLTRRQGNENEALHGVSAVLARRPGLINQSPDVAEDIVSVATARTFLLHRLSHSHEVKSSVFSPDGKRVLTATKGPSVQLWDTASGKQIATIVDAPLHHATEITAAEFSPDGARILTVSSDHLCLWSAATLRLLADRKIERINYAIGTFSPDGRTIALSSIEGNVAGLLDSHTLQPRVRLQGHTALILSIAFSANSRFVVTGSTDRSARVWSADSGRLVRTVEHPASVTAAAFSPCYEEVVSVTSGGNIRRWNWQTGETIQDWHAHDDAIVTVGFSPDGSRFLTASKDHLVKIWNARRNFRQTVPLTTFTLHSKNVNDSRFSPDGRHIVTGSDDNEAQIWSLPDPALAGQGNMIDSVEFSPDGSRLVTSSADGSVWVWDAKTRKRLWELDGADAPVYHATFSPDGERVACAANNGKIGIWLLPDLPAGEYKVKNPTFLPDSSMKQVRCVRFSPDGDRIAACGDGPAIQIWNLRHPGRIVAFRGHVGAVQCISFSGDGNRIVSGGFDGTVRVWDSWSGIALLRPIKAHDQRVWDAEFSPDGKKIASAGGDSIVRVWNAETGNPVTSYSGHSGDAMAATFSPDGKWLLTACLDGSARMWHAGDPRKPVYRVEAHDLAITWVAFSPDGAQFATASQDGTVRLFPVRVQDYLAQAKRLTQDIVQFGRGDTRVATDAGWNDPKAIAKYAEPAPSELAVVGAGSEQQTLFQDCYHRYGGERVMGNPTGRAYGWEGMDRQDLRLGTDGPKGALIYSSVTGRVYWFQGDILKHYDQIPEWRRALGIPLPDPSGEAMETQIAAPGTSGAGYMQEFERGTIYSSREGTYAVLLHMEDAYRAAGGPLGFGYPREGINQAATSLFGTTGNVQRFERGMIHWSRRYGAHSTPYSLSAYYDSGGSRGPYGFPVGDARVQNGVLTQDFEGGTIPTPKPDLAPGEGSIHRRAYQECVRICNAYYRVGQPVGPCRPFGAGEIQPFMSPDTGPTALIYNPATGKVNWILGGIWIHYMRMGGSTSVLGLPTKGLDDKPMEWLTGRTKFGAAGSAQFFDHGAIFYSLEYGSSLIDEAVLAEYRSLGLHMGPLGLPKAPKTAADRAKSGDLRYVQPFEGGAICEEGTRAVAVHGGINAEWLARDGATGSLGFPLGDERVEGENHVQEFEGGRIVWSPRGGPQVTATARRGPR